MASSMSSTSSNVYSRLKMLAKSPSPPEVGAPTVVSSSSTRDDGDVGGGRGPPLLASDAGSERSGALGPDGVASSSSSKNASVSSMKPPLATTSANATTSTNATGKKKAIVIVPSKSSGGGGLDPPKSWKDYMKLKKLKLQQQFEKPINEGDGAGSTLFAGITITVNGYTEPSTSQLREMVLQHGGAFSQYSSSSITHTIATNLPMSKLKELKSTSKVVHPDWILDSIAANKVLPYQNYSLPYYSKSTSNNVTTVSSTAATSSKVGMNHAVPSGNSSVATTNISSKSAATNANNPDFISTYHKNSRLHHLSAWKSQFQEALSSELLSMAQTLVDSTLTPPMYGNSTLEDDVKAKDRMIFHVDMDCFFASVAVLENPSLKGKPIAICHSNSSDGYAEVSSASYEARKKGVKNGMLIGRAKELCPDLVVVGYNFEAYERVSRTVYQMLMEFTYRIQVVSCDEAYLNMTGVPDHKDAAEKIRQRIFQQTGCTASIGIGSNILLARLATKKAKPNGVFLLHQDQAKSTLANLPVIELPGVGHSMASKLDGLGISTCSDVIRKSSLQQLQKELGEKKGKLLWCFAHGIDTRPLKLFQQRKSVGVDVNYGMRFTDEEQVRGFIENLARELAQRAKNAKAKGRLLLLKIKKRQPGAPPPRKFMGHGLVDNYSKSAKLSEPLCEAESLFEEAWALYKQLNFLADDIRGIGLHLQNLEFTSEAPRIPQPQGMTDEDRWKALKKNQQTTLSPYVEKKKKKSKGKEPHPNQSLHIAEHDPGDASDDDDETFEINKPVAQVALPSLSQLDPEVISELPEDVREEIQNIYVSRAVATNKRAAPTKETKKREPSKKKKTVAPPADVIVAEENMVTADNIDVEVFDALPEELKKEIVANINQKDAPPPPPPKKSTDGVASSVFQMVLSEEPKQQHNSKIRLKPLEPLTHQFEELKQVIVDWINSSEMPSKLQVDFMKEQLLKLVNNLGLEEVAKVMNFYRRSCGKVPADAAAILDTHKQLYTELYSAIQSQMMLNYGGSLAIKPLS